jgi:hypothetical protein
VGQGYKWVYPGWEIEVVSGAAAVVESARAHEGELGTMEDLVSMELW